jgi:hypothetical protein
MCNDDAREEVPMTADPVGEVLGRTRARDRVWADLQELSDGHRYMPVGVPFPVERPADLAGPRRRG